MNIGEKVLLRYCQSWGQSAQERIEILNMAVSEANMDAKFVQYEKDGKIVAGWEGEDAEKAAKFREELDSGWCQGNFETEAAWINALIEKYRKETDQEYLDNLTELRIWTDK